MQFLVILILVDGISWNFNHSVHALRTAFADGKPHVIRHILFTSHLALQRLLRCTLSGIHLRYSYSKTQIFNQLTESWRRRLAHNDVKRNSLSVALFSLTVGTGFPLFWWPREVRHAQLALAFRAFVFHLGRRPGVHNLRRGRSTRPHHGRRD